MGLHLKLTLTLGLHLKRMLTGQVHHPRWNRALGQSQPDMPEKQSATLRPKPASLV